jgi:hypothetical protein
MQADSKLDLNQLAVVAAECAAMMSTLQAKMRTGTRTGKAVLQDADCEDVAS